MPRCARCHLDFQGTLFAPFGETHCPWCNDLLIWAVLPNGAGPSPTPRPAPVDGSGAPALETPTGPSEWDESTLPVPLWAEECLADRRRREMIAGHNETTLP